MATRANPATQTEIDLADYDFELPMELVAHEPTEARDACRLIVLHRASGLVEHSTFAGIGRYLRPGDLIVLNDTKVIPGKYLARRPDGGRVEVLLYSRGDGGTWVIAVKPNVRLRPGDRLEGDGLPLGLSLVGPYGPLLWEARYDLDDLSLVKVLEEHGEMCLPLYLSLGGYSPDRYQTVYAEKYGSTQSPTAGLHFTPELIQALEEEGVVFARVTLHVGMSTYADPRQALADKRMYRELMEVSPEAAEAVNSARGRVIAVGTTVVRTLETAATGAGRIKPCSGWTELFISPGFKFRVVQAMITNFHQPMSTRILLVSAFAGREKILAAYREAVERRYMFYDFGDSMLII